MFFLKSWDSCKNNTRRVTCSSGEDRCVKAHVEGKVNGLSLAMYAKGCAEAADCTEDGCKKLPQDPRLEITMCKYECCSDGLCKLENLSCKLKTDKRKEENHDTFKSNLSV